MTSVSLIFVPEVGARRACLRSEWLFIGFSA
jgi:hypothetical protein